MPVSIRGVRALVPAASGDLRPHDPSRRHWIFDSKIASPMSRWPPYRDDRRSWGIDALGSVVVEVETTSGHVGIAPSVGGPAAAYIVEHHLARFVEGIALDRTAIETAWEQMYAATLFYGRRGLVVNAISAIDLALWDALGQTLEAPVWSLLGGTPRDELALYATTPDIAAARELGFVGGKLPLPAGTAEGAAGVAENLAAAAAARAACEDDDFFLAADCFMSMELEFATEVARGLADLGFIWIEEPLSPDDYGGQRLLRERISPRIQHAAGEHEATRWGFALLFDGRCIDIAQPDVGWCGGLTELLRIARLADAAGVLVIPHGSSVYSYHFCATRPQTPFGEFALLDPEGATVSPQLAPLLLGEPLPENGRVRIPETPGFGVTLNRDLELARPYAR